MDPIELIDILNKGKISIEIDISSSKIYKNQKTTVDSIISDTIKISARKKGALVERLMSHFVSHGIKSSLRGIKFNNEVAKKIQPLVRRKPHIIFSLETSHRLLFEKPDWMLYNCRTRSTLVGYNQIDLWGGGHQINRGSKYILDQALHARLSRHKVKLVAVVAGGPSTLTKGTKKYDIVNTGIEKKRLFTPSALPKLIRDFISR